MRRLAVIIFVWSLAAGGTKPCPEDPCQDMSKCGALAKWVIVGKVMSIRHHPNPPPVFKDFAEFVVQVERWEKGKPALKQLKFQVGWCNNSRPPPDRVGARVRIYGDGDPLAERPQYLGLEELD